MEEEKKKKRGWVKDAAIIFLVVLLVLTFFSNTILNRSLPEVATVYVQEGTITNKVRGTGTVTARENYDVTIDQTRKVQSVLVRVGDEVTVGDVLFTLQPGDSDELEKAEKQLRSLEESYQLWLLDLSVADYFNYDRDIADAREALVEARDARDEIAITDDDKLEYEAKLAELAAELAELEVKQTELEAEIERQESVVDAAGESVTELDDRSGTLREMELQMRELKDLQHEKEVLIREKQEALDNATERAEAMKADKQKDVDEAQGDFDDIDNEIKETYGMGEHQDADYKAVDAAKAALDAAEDATFKADKDLQVAKVVYKEDYADLVREATFMEFDDKVYAILDDVEVKYRADNKIAKNEDLTEEQEAEIQEKAQPSIDKLGSRNAYEPKRLSIYLAAAAERYPGTDMAMAYQKIRSAQEALSDAQDREDEAYEAYEKAYKEYKQNKKDDEEFDSLDRQRDRAKSSLDKAKSDMDKAMEPVNQLVEQAERDLKRAKAEKTDVENEISDLQYRIDKVRNESLADRKTDLDEAKQDLEALKADLEKNKSDQEKNKADQEKLEADMKGREEEYKRAQDNMKTKERALEDALRSLEKQKTADGKQQIRDNISQRDKLEEIEEQRALVEELSGADNGTEVRANVSGKIQELNVSAGHKAEAGNVLATIEVPDLGYGMKFTVTTEQARRLKVGDSATVSNYYWGSQIVATLASIQTDPQNPQGSRILNFDVTGDVTAGNSLTIAVGEKNANYDLVVPNSAIRSDTNGSFVLVVTAKNSPLGNRYFASRVNVEVVASDDQYSAISGAIEAYDSVITTASRNAPISSGDQVRLADNNN
ncbi:MAG: biotin/lipoyl-binding protein [Oscillospiraceae bacterium]|nr:biotin/lipoyl-binding protein [Oscillospiraceae bacterium]